MTFKRVLITGITGSGGSYLAEYIINNVPNVEVGGTTRWHSTGSPRNIKNVADKIKLFYCDMTDMGRLLHILADYQPDVIFHIASLANVRDSFDNPAAVINNNIAITLNLFEAVRFLKKTLNYDPIIQLCSTSEVYGIVDPVNIPVTENCPLQAVNPYAASKLCQDSLGLVYFKSFNLKIVRTRMFTYLNARRGDLFATAFARQVVEIESGNRTVLKHGNLDSIRTIVDVRDAAEAYWLTVIHGVPGEVYNIGGSTPVRVGMFLELLKKYASCDIKSEPDPTLFRPVDILLQIPDCSKFKALTNWQPKYTLDESIQFFLAEVRSLHSR